jgi:hypothetical protein
VLSLLAAWIIAAGTPPPDPSPLPEASPAGQHLSPEAFLKALDRLGSDTIATPEVTMIKPRGWLQRPLTDPNQHLRLATDDSDRPRAMMTLRRLTPRDTDTPLSVSNLLRRRLALQRNYVAASEVWESGDFTMFVHCDIQHGTPSYNLFGITSRNRHLWLIEVNWQKDAYTTDEATLLMMSLRVK